MTTNITFTIQGQAVPTPRPRVTKRGVYYPQRYKDWFNAIRFQARDLAGADLDSPVAITLLFHTKWHKVQDIDNLSKGVLDALTGILWDDDRVVCTLIAQKDPPPAGTDPDVHVEISTLPGWQMTSAWMVDHHDEARYELTDLGRQHLATVPKERVWPRDASNVELQLGHLLPLTKPFHIKPSVDVKPVDEWAKGPPDLVIDARLLDPTEEDSEL